LHGKDLAPFGAEARAREGPGAFNAALVSGHLEDLVGLFDDELPHFSSYGTRSEAATVDDRF
jgi:hypothetical protein